MLVKSDKIAVLDNNIRQLAGSIYDLTISAQVAKKIGNTEGMDQRQERLETLTKTLNEYETILKELKKGEK